MPWFVGICLLLCLWMHGVAVQAATVSEIAPLANQAMRAFEQGDFLRSENLWSQILALNPENAAVWSNRGNVRLSQNKLSEALEDFNRSVALTPNNPDPYLNRGIAWERLQQWDKALGDYDRVLSLSPQDAYAWNNRGNALLGKEAWQEALENYRKAAEIDPKFAFARANAALVLYQLEEDENALTEVRNLVRRYPNLADMRALLSAILWNRHQRGEAESNWVAVVGLDNRYKDLEWVKNVRRWPPRPLQALQHFLALE